MSNIDMIDGVALLIDAAGPRVQTGIWSARKWLVWHESREEAGRAIFTCTRRCLEETGIDPRELDAFLFCEGPGSSLGVRIAAMAIQGWKAVIARPTPVYAYSSLAALGEMLRENAAPLPFYTIADARRDMWHVLQVKPDGSGPQQLLTNNALSELPGPFFRMEEIRRGDPPVTAQDVIYSLHEHPKLFAGRNITRRMPTAMPLQTSRPEYVKWVPSRHRLH